MTPRVGQPVQYFEGAGAAPKAAIVVSVDVADDPDPRKQVVTTRLAVLEFAPGTPDSSYTDGEGRQVTQRGEPDGISAHPVTAPYGQPGKTDGPYWAPIS